MEIGPPILIETNCQTISQPQINHPVLPKRGGNNNLDGRMAISKMKNGMEKLDSLLAIESRIPNNLGDLTDAARNFVNNQVHPILGCFHNHFGSNKVEFIRRWNNFATSTFRKTNCRGKESCGI